MHQRLALATMLIFTASLAGGALASSTATARSAAQDPDRTTRSRPDDVERTAAALRKQVAETRLDHVPLNRAIDSLCTRSGARVDVRWDVMARAGIERATPVVLRIRAGKTLRRALELVCESAGKDDVRLAVFVDAFTGKITISTRADAGLDRPRTHTFDVRDILAKAIPQAATDAERREELTNLIQETVDPDSWIDNGGTLGRVSFKEGMMTVTQGSRSLTEIATLLATVREQGGLPPPPKPEEPEFPLLTTKLGQ